MNTDITDEDMEDWNEDDEFFYQMTMTESKEEAEQLWEQYFYNRTMKE